MQASAARQARRAWSGRGVGAFQNAMTASPMNLSTVPPVDWMARVIASRYAPSAFASASGAMRSASVVNPSMSVNIIEMSSSSPPTWLAIGNYVELTTRSIGTYLPRARIDVFARSTPSMTCSAKHLPAVADEAIRIACQHQSGARDLGTGHPSFERRRVGDGIARDPHALELQCVAQQRGQARHGERTAFARSFATRGPRRHDRPRITTMSMRCVSVSAAVRSPTSASRQSAGRPRPSWRRAPGRGRSARRRS